MSSEFSFKEVSSSECRLSELSENVSKENLSPENLNRSLAKDIGEMREPTDSKTSADTKESDYPSTYKDRIDRTPSEISNRGEWVGERGESTYIPSSEDMKQLLDQFDLKGIEYKDGIPDFSKCSEGTVKIDNMSEKRYGPDGNFAQCDEKCAEQWNKDEKDGKSDWTARDVQKWREDNGYSWHERNDMKTCDLIPTEINDYFNHLGGVAECKKRDITQNSGGDFDD